MCETPLRVSGCRLQSRGATVAALHVRDVFRRRSAIDSGFLNILSSLYRLSLATSILQLEVVRWSFVL